MVLENDLPRIQLPTNQPFGGSSLTGFLEGHRGSVREVEASPHSANDRDTQKLLVTESNRCLIQCEEHDFAIFDPVHTSTVASFCPVWSYALLPLRQAYATDRTTVSDVLRG